MPNQVEPKAVDPEAELSNAQATFNKLAPMCSVAKRAGGIPQLAPQEKQLSILHSEIKETKLCLTLATTGPHGKRDAKNKKTTFHHIVEYEELESKLRDERAQQGEMECLNYLAAKRVADLLKQVPTESDELAMLEDANNRLRRMENRLDLATKRFCVVNFENKHVREDIHRLLVERNDFNIQWKRVIDRLLAGKLFLMDILEIATLAFGDRDECSRKLETLKWAGLHQLNKDIAEMQSYEGELNHLAKLEEFLRVKGSKRICEADEIEEMKRLEEIARCEQEITRHDDLLEAVFTYAKSTVLKKIQNNFVKNEIKNDSCFILLCEMLQECIKLKKTVDGIRQIIRDQRDINEGREETQNRRLAQITSQLAEQRERTQKKLEDNTAAEALFVRVLKNIDDIVRLVKCNTTPLLSLLGNHKEVTRWNVGKFLSILEMEVKSLIQVAYGAVKPPAPTPTAKGRKGPAAPAAKLVADPFIETIRPNRIEILVPYRPCAYCVEDYMMNQVFETPAVPADKDYVQNIFHLEDVNTKFGIFTLTIPTKRHPYTKKD